MKKTLQTLSLVGISAVSLISFTKNNGTIGVYNHFEALNGAGAQFGKTGAPGEQNCTQCHSGIAITNSSAASMTFSGAANLYIPGSTYSMTVSLPSGSPKNGFEIVALRMSDDASIGTFSLTDATNTQLKMGMGRTYVTHTSAGNSQSTWSFDWVAPATNEGNIKFYYAANLTNNNGTTSGDEIHLVELVIEADPSSAIVEQTEIVDIDNSLKIRTEGKIFTPSFDLENDKAVSVTVVSLSGKSVYSNSERLHKGSNTLNSIDLSNQAKGIYIINFSFGNETISRKVNL